eukprot:SAG11_NODE_193_length_12862_cov_7.128888_9_plen_269_part_00
MAGEKTHKINLELLDQLGTCFVLFRFVPCIIIGATHGFQEIRMSMWARLESMFSEMDPDDTSRGALDSKEVQAALFKDAASYAELMPSDAQWPEIFAELDRLNSTTDSTADPNHEAAGKISKAELFAAWEKTKPAHTLTWLDQELEAHQQRLSDEKLNVHIEADGTELDLGALFVQCIILPATARYMIALVVVGQTEICWALVLEMVDGDDGLPSENLYEETVEIVQTLMQLDIYIERRLCSSANEVMHLVACAPFSIVPRLVHASVR